VVRATRKPVVVVAGEDSTDRKCLRILLEAFCPSMAGRIVEINDAVRLRQAGDAALAARVDSLANKVRARATREDAEVACVFVHEDFDACDSDHFPIVRDRVQRALDRRLGNARYTLAVWETDAPDVIEKAVCQWPVRSPRRRPAVVPADGHLVLPGGGQIVPRRGLGCQFNGITPLPEVA
jgi:hypothetical protein